MWYKLLKDNEVAMAHKMKLNSWDSNFTEKENLE